MAVSTQHPGLYLQAAAYHSRQANDAIVAMKDAPQIVGISYPQPDPLKHQVPIAFYGQRPWRALVDGGGLADDITEKNACIALLVRYNS